MFITACNECGNSPPHSQYTTYVYTQKTRYQKLHGAIGGSPWIRLWTLLHIFRGSGLPQPQDLCLWRRDYAFCVAGHVHSGDDRLVDDDRRLERAGVIRAARFGQNDRPRRCDYFHHPLRHLSARFLCLHQSAGPITW